MSPRHCGEVGVRLKSGWAVNIHALLALCFAGPALPGELSLQNQLLSTLMPESGPILIRCDRKTLAACWTTHSAPGIRCDSNRWSLVAKEPCSIFEGTMSVTLVACLVVPRRAKPCSVKSLPVAPQAGTRDQRVVIIIFVEQFNSEPADILLLRQSTRREWIPMRSKFVFLYHSWSGF